MNTLGNSCLALAVLSALAACSPLPTRGIRPVEKPAANYAAAGTFAAPPANWPTDAWWSAYADPQLDTLIAEALSGSPSVAIADARLRRAEAIAGSARASQLPRLDANSSVTSQRQSRNYLTPPQATPEGWRGYGRATLDFSWELDFWGKNRAAFAAATSDTEAVRADAAQARLAIAAAVASTYAEFARDWSALDTSRAAIEVRTRTAALFRQRYDHGLETLGGVRQTDSRRASAEADVRAVEERIDLHRNALAALLGQGPDRGALIARPTIALVRPFGLPPDLSLGLVGRRPDVAAARLRAQAAARRIDQAEAAFYPDVNLMAFIGVQSLGLDRLAKSGSSLGSVGPAVSLPIFDGGRLRGQLREVEAEYAESVSEYDRTLVEALQEVANAVVSTRALGPQLAKTDEAVDAAREAWRVQSDRYRGGLASHLDVLVAEDTLISVLGAQSDLRSRSFVLDVALIRALGGGYSSPHP